MFLLLLLSSLCWAEEENTPRVRRDPPRPQISFFQCNAIDSWGRYYGGSGYSEGAARQSALSNCPGSCRVSSCYRTLQ